MTKKTYILLVVSLYVFAIYLSIALYQEAEIVNNESERFIACVRK